MIEHDTHPNTDSGKRGQRWMRPDRSLVKAAHLNLIAKLRGHDITKFPSGIATGRIEIAFDRPNPAPSPSM
jgi:hypothetical protein